LPQLHGVEAVHLTGEILLHVIVHPRDQRDHGDEEGDADNGAEDGKKRAQLVRADHRQGDADGLVARGREDVHDAAADGELTTRLDLRGAAVAELEGRVRRPRDQAGNAIRQLARSFDQRDRQSKVMTIVKSRSFSEEFIATHDLLPVLYPDRNPPPLWQAAERFGRVFEFRGSPFVPGAMALRV
jgi:hypothetical protein